MMLLVPAPTENSERGQGCDEGDLLRVLPMNRAAIATIQSMPPAACISAAAVTTARMMAIAAPGARPAPRRRRRPGRRCRPAPQADPDPAGRVPMTMAMMTTAPSDDGGGGLAHCLVLPPVEMLAAVSITAPR